MDDQVPERFRPVITAAVDRLVAKDYAGLRADGLVAGSNDPDDDSVGLWIEQYPATLVPLPPEAWEHAMAGETVEPRVWWVTVDLWTAEEGRSDLTLEGHILDRDPPVLTIDDVHVL